MIPITTRVSSSRRRKERKKYRCIGDNGAPSEIGNGRWLHSSWWIGSLSGRQMEVAVAFGRRWFHVAHLPSRVMIRRRVRSLEVCASCILDGMNISKFKCVNELAKKDFVFEFSWPDSFDRTIESGIMKWIGLLWKILEIFQYFTDFS